MDRVYNILKRGVKNVDRLQKVIRFITIGVNCINLALNVTTRSGEKRNEVVVSL